MKRQYILILVAVLLVSLTGSLFAGGGRRNGTGGASELLIPVGVRGISLGGSVASVSSGIEAAYWNPAGLSRTSNSVEASFSYMSYIADMGVTYGSVSANIPDLGTVNLGIKSLSIGEIPVTTTLEPDGTGKTFTPQYMTAGVSFARSLSDRISVGITGNLIMETIDQVSATGFAFNIGVMYENLGNINGLSMAVVMKNLGPQMKFTGSGLYTTATVDAYKRPSQNYEVLSAPFELPSSLEFGFGYKASINEENSVLVTTAFENQNFYGDMYKFGAEYTYNNLISLRGGYALTPEDQEAGYIYGLTAGAGINYNMGGTLLRFDYAYRDVDVFDGNHVFSLTIGF